MDIRIVGDKAKTSKVFAIPIYLDAVGFSEISLRSEKTRAVKTGVRMSPNPNLQSSGARRDKGSENVWIVPELLAERNRIMDFIDIKAKNPGMRQDLCACALRESAGGSNSRKPLFKEFTASFATL